MADGLPMVMLWRRVANLHRARVLTDKTMEMPVVGADEYSIIYDAGGAMLGLWTQDDNALLAADSCSGLNFTRYPLVSNPTSEAVLVPRDINRALTRLSSVTNVFFTPPMERAEGLTVPFFDDAGNMSSFLQPNEARFRTGAGEKLRGLLTTRGVRGDVGPDQWASTGLVGHNLLVADLRQSSTFYTDVLGLEALGTTDRTADFDAGRLILSLHQEPAEGLVASVRSTGRLMGDWLIFLAENIHRQMEQLGSRGAVFPRGVETSGIGQMAYFEDPDGHALVLWQPSGSTTRGQPIDVYPVLERVRSELRG